MCLRIPERSKRKRPLSKGRPVLNKHTCRPEGSAHFGQKDTEVLGNLVRRIGDQGDLHFTQAAILAWGVAPCKMNIFAVGGNGSNFATKTPEFLNTIAESNDFRGANKCEITRVEKQYLRGIFRCEEKDESADTPLATEGLNVKILDLAVDNGLGLETGDLVADKCLRAHTSWTVGPAAVAFGNLLTALALHFFLIRRRQECIESAYLVGEAGYGRRHSGISEATFVLTLNLTIDATHKRQCHKRGRMAEEADTCSISRSS